MSKSYKKNYNHKNNYSQYNKPFVKETAPVNEPGTVKDISDIYNRVGTIEEGVDVVFSKPWKLYTHHINNNNWNISGYVYHGQINNAFDFWIRQNFLESKAIYNISMTFYMDANYLPLWEDNSMKDGVFINFFIPADTGVNKYTLCVLQILGCFGCFEENFNFTSEIIGISQTPKNDIIQLRYWLKTDKYLSEFIDFCENKQTIIDGKKHYVKYIKDIFNVKNK